MKSNELELIGKLFSSFLIDKEGGEPRRIRYLVVGFGDDIVEATAKALAASLGAEVTIIDTEKEYKKAIQYRAEDEPVLVKIKAGKIGEFASLANTYKILANSFELQARKRVRDEAEVYDLYSVLGWIFSRENLADMFKYSCEVNRVKLGRSSADMLSDILRSAWSIADQKYPSLKQRFSPYAIIDILVRPSHLREPNPNTVLALLGFEPSLNLSTNNLSSGAAVHIADYIENSRRVLAQYLLGSFPDIANRLGALCENIVRGILIFAAMDSSSAKSVGLKDALELLRSYEERYKQRRIYRVTGKDTSITQYSSVSGLPKAIDFRITQMYPSVVYATTKFKPERWNRLFEKENVLAKFLAFMETKRLVGNSSNCLMEPPFNLKVREKNVLLTFNYLEGYLFGSTSFREEVERL